MRKNEIFFKAFVNALGVFVYVLLVAWFIFNAETLLGKVDTFLGPAMMLLIFVISAAVTGLLVLGMPIVLYLDGKRKEAVTLFAYTLISLVVITVFVILFRILL